jgi:hypothetical protein
MKFKKILKTVECAWPLALGHVTLIMEISGRGLSTGQKICFIMKLANELKLALKATCRNRWSNRFIPLNFHSVNHGARSRDV